MKSRDIPLWHKVLENLWSRPWKIGIILGVTTLIAGYFFLHLRMDMREEAMFNEDDPELRYYEDQFLKDFDTVEALCVGVEARQILNGRVLSMIDRMANRFERIEGVAFVVSLTNQQIMLSTMEELELFSIRELLPELSHDDLDKARKAILSTPLFRKTGLISDDLEASAIWIYAKPSSWELQNQGSVVKEVREIVHQECHETDVKCYISGLAYTELLLQEIFKRDTMLVVPAMVFLIVLVMYSLFRSWKVVGVTVLVVAIGAIWTLGFAGAVSYPLTAISQILFVILLLYTIFDMVHLVSHYQFLSRSLPRSKAIRQTIKEVGPPCFLNTLTTFLGLISLTIAEVIIIKQFGVTAAFGIAVVLLITFLLWVYSFQEKRESNDFRALTPPQNGLLQKVLSFIVRASLCHPLLIFNLAIVLIIGFGWGIKKLQADTRWDQLYREDTESIKMMRFAEHHYGGWIPAWIVFDTGKSDGLKGPEVLRDLDKVSRYLEDLPEVGYTFSIVDPIKNFHQAIKGGGIQEYRLPEENPGRLFALLEGFGSHHVFNAVSNEDFSKGAIWMLMWLLPSGEASQFLKKVELDIYELLNTPMKVKITGAYVLQHHLVDMLFSSQIKSFAFALFVISIVMIFVLRSLPLGILALLPNLFPIVLTLGLMGLLNINLDVGTAMIASIIFGVVVDDTVHFLFRFRRELENSRGDYEKAIRNTFFKVGKPIIYTSLVLAIGFSTLAFSEYLPAARFGLLSSFSVLAALLGDLFLLPALLFLFRPIVIKQQRRRG